MPAFPPEVEAIFEKLDRLLYSDSEQNKLVPAQVRSSIVGGINCDVLPGARGEFGLNPSNPIPTNGPIGEVLYLSRLRTQTGNPVMFHRVRSEEGPLGVVDVYEVLSTDRTVRQNLFLSMYHPRKSKHTPKAYKYAARFDNSNFTYGVNHIVPRFPEKLDAYIRRWQMDTLGIPLPVGIVREAINGSGFQPSVLDEAESAPSHSTEGAIRDDILKLLHASQDPRFEGQSIAIGIDGIVRPTPHISKHLESLGALLQKLDKCLSKYVSVHNDVFAIKPTRIVPLPGVFDPIDFDRNAEILQEILDDLASVGMSLGQLNRSDGDLPLRYVQSLHAAASMLKNIALSLRDKANGAPYDWSTYNSSVDEYESLVKAFQMMEGRLDAWRRSLAL
jgi:hypothetical protein